MQKENNQLTSSCSVGMRDINGLLQSAPISRIKTLRDDEGRRGFTLIELLVVVLIIGILAAIALPQYQKAVEKARTMEAIAILKTLRDQQALCFLEHGIDDLRCMQGADEVEGNLFTMANVKLNISGAPDPDCELICGPSSNDFSYELDGQFIDAQRKPVYSKYMLETTAFPDSETTNTFSCYNFDENKNWCNIVGFTRKGDNNRYFQN